MNIHRGSHNTLAKPSMHNATANGNGTGIDTLGYTHAMVIITVTSSGASGGTVNLQDSADNSAWSANLSGVQSSLGASLTNQVFLMDVNCKIRQRYIRPVLSGVSGTVAVTITVILLNPVYSAPTQDNAVASI